MPQIDIYSLSTSLHIMFTCIVFFYYVFLIEFFIPILRSKKHPFLRYCQYFILHEYALEIYGRCKRESYSLAVSKNLIKWL